MKKTWMVLLLALSLGLHAQTGVVGATRLAANLDLSWDIPGLARLAQGPEAEAGLAALSGRTLILSGSVGTVLEAGDEPYYLVVEVLAGAWIDQSRLSLHRLYVLVEDPLMDQYFSQAEGQRVLFLAQEPQLVAGIDGQPRVLLRVRSLLPPN